MLEQPLATTEMTSILDARALKVGIADALDEVADRVREPVILEQWGQPKLVSDATAKYLIRTQSGRRVAVVLCSRPAAPHIVARGQQHADAIRTILGKRLGSVISKPLKVGEVEGCSYVLLPYYQPFSRRKMYRGYQRFRVRGQLLAWLRNATKRVADFSAPSPETAESFRTAIKHVDCHLPVKNREPNLGSTVQHALERLDSGIWKPRHSFDHNDLWLGNVLLTRGACLSEPTPWPFVVIDWGGAKAEGYGVYDLLRVAVSMKLSSRILRREVDRHATALQCSSLDIPGHLLASLGRLHQNLEHFPEERYWEMFHQCWQRLSAVNSSIADGG